MRVRSTDGQWLQCCFLAPPDIEYDMSLSRAWWWELEQKTPKVITLGGIKFKVSGTAREWLLCCILLTQLTEQTGKAVVAGLDMTGHVVRTIPSWMPAGVRRASALSGRSDSRNSARADSMRYGSLVPSVTRSSTSTPV